MRQLRCRSRVLHDIASFQAILLILFFSFTGVCFAQAPPAAGKIVNISGQVSVLTTGDTRGKPASIGRILQAGDTVVTGPNGKAAVLLADESLMLINKNSRFILKAVAAKAWWQKVRTATTSGVISVQSSLRVERGEVWFRNKNRDIRVNIEAPTAVLGVRGTEMNLKVAEDDAVTLTVMEGEVQAQNNLGIMNVGAREQIVARPHMPFVKTVLLTPEDAVQWTIPIPPLFDDQDASPEVKQAFLQLRTGNVKDAQRLMTEWTRNHPDQSPAWTLLALTSVMLGEKSQALEAAKKAAAANPRSMTALLVQSYAFQASFDLDQALAATRQALALDRQNVSALNHLARLRFGMDDIDEAYRTVREAQQLAPENGEAQNLLGFILLGREKTDEAIAAFNRAIALDPSLGEPHMGLGIAYMRKADTATAMEEICTAVLLEPRRSLFLSYWGKMLYQIQRFDKAMDMLKLAGELDPRDPTPELYKSFVYRDQNQPTEAVTAVNKSMELNDNRAVYRSRFLLDRDAAVKNVDLSILFSQLGLNAWARSKALASVKQDYTNASGHLFMAGALQDADDRSWPMQSEYLLARMLMPANVNSFNTYNEYTAFFEKPALNGTVQGTIGNFNTRQGDVIAYGAIPGANLAFGAQASIARTDGWRNTNGDDAKTMATYMKWNPTPKDGFLGVVSYGQASQNDISYPRYEYYPRYNTDRVSVPNAWNNSDMNRFELGYHRNFSPDSNLLLYVARRGNSGTVYIPAVASFPGIGPMDLTTFDEVPYSQLQGQYMHKLGSHQIILGTNQYFGDNYRTVYYYLPNWNLSLPQPKVTKVLNMQSYYIYDTWKVNNLLTLDGAVCYDRLDNSDPTEGVQGTSWSTQEWGGRIGGIIKPNKTDTFRLATFRYLLPFITSRLDPTDVAGVSVLRNNYEGSLMEEWHGVWEHEWSSGYLSTDVFYLEKTLHA